MKKVCIITLGCKTNQYESQALGEALEAENYEVCFKLCYADIYILNTCAVTNEAERKSRQYISKFNKLNQDCKIFVCGCASQNNFEQFVNLPNVQYVTGNAKILNLVNRIKTKKGAIVEKFPEVYEDICITKAHNARAYIKIQDGCNRFCSYCLIPYLRGKSRSRNMLSILQEIDCLAKQSVKEIILTGVDISDYKIDDKLALLTLLEQIDNYGIRFRISSFEPNILTEEFVKAISKLKNLCPHFHISMQSGCTETLKRMNRHYTSNFFVERVKLLRTYFDNPAITTDIIVGFPGETSEEFTKTLNTVKKIKFAQIHIFPYSRRSGTTADKLLADKTNPAFFAINGDIIKLRVRTLSELAKKLETSFINSNKNKIFNAIIETQKNNFKEFF